MKLCHTEPKIVIDEILRSRRWSHKIMRGTFFKNNERYFGLWLVHKYQMWQHFTKYVHSYVHQDKIIHDLISFHWTVTTFVSCKQETLTLPGYLVSIRKFVNSGVCNSSDVNSHGLALPPLDLTPKKDLYFFADYSILQTDLLKHTTCIRTYT